MHLESPAFKRCCLCLPLRRGLIGWGYFRLALGILAVASFISLSILVLTVEHPPESHNYIMVTCICCFWLWDIAFNLILIIAGQKKSAKLLKVSFILGSMWIIMFLACGLYLLYLNIRPLMNFSYYYHYFRYMLYCPLVIISFTFAITFVHVYVMLMIRSEEKKLRNQSIEMQFVNNAAEGEATCVYAFAPTANMTQ